MGGRRATDAIHFRFYPDDFLSSPNVMAMTDEEVGCYVRLLCVAWSDDGLPDDLDRIARLLRRRGRAFEDVWAALEPCFPLADDGRRRNPRQEVERGQLRAWKAKMAEAGAKGAAARWGGGE